MGTATAAAIYARISHDAEGQELGVSRQVDDCHALAARHGLTVVDTYTDNDMGASAVSRRKRRPAYARMLADVRAGRVSVIVAYSNSRLTRRLLELEDLIQLHEQHGTRILTVVSGEDNLSTADGRMVARIKASVDAAEAERAAERVTRKHLELAQAGRVVGGGHRPFGWEPDQITIRPEEADLIREAAADVLEGLPLRRIAERWNNAEAYTSKGKRWTNGLVLQLLRSPRLAGWRVHRTKGTKWAPVPPVAIGKDGEPVRGQWEPILDDATHRALVVALTQPTDKRTRIPRRNARHYMLTGLLRCAECNAPMYGNRVKDAHYYRCDTGQHSNVASGRGVDAFVGARVVEASTLVRAIAHDEVTPARARLAEAERNIADTTDMIDDIMRAYRAKDIPGRVAFKNASELEEARERFMRDRDEAQAEVLQEQPHHVDADTWEAYDTDQRRAVCEQQLSAVYIRPATRRGNTFDTTRVDLVWK